ncbi:hypothetical protein SLS53_005480 [Cytospora paraplurivora]|uniref:E3 ubiquitin-protein ligase UBR1-like winged-helix domain-containing protein n=1 Tax=Cytospora paraplurivora TaxID=2898453 RepID=A0AAN9YFT8_9PEZI
MVVRIPETGLHLESSAKSADTLPLQAFALTINDNSFLCNGEVHKISKASEIPNLDLYLSDPSDSTQEAERLPHPTMSLFMRPDFRRFPKLAAGRVVVKEKAVPTKAPAAARKQNNLSDDVARLKEVMAQAKTDKMENSCVALDYFREGTKIVNTPIAGVKRGTTKSSKTKLLPSAKGSTVTISRSGAASPALSGTGSPSLAPTLSSDERAKREAKELRSPIVHELAVKEMSFEELRSRWPGEEKDFKTALDKVADFDSNLQKFAMKKMYWKELDVFNYEYDTDEERQKAIDNAIRMYDRMRIGTSEPQWQRLLPKEERGKGKCLSKLQASIAKSTAQAMTPQIRVHDAYDSSASKNGDDNLSGVDKKNRKGGEPMSRSASQTKQPAKKLEKKLLSQKKASTPKISPTKGAKPSKDKGARPLSKEFKSKEFISASDESSSEEAPLSTTVARSKAVEKERGREKHKLVERVKEERGKAKEALAPSSAPKPKPKPSAPKELIKPQIAARPVVPKRHREDPDDDSSSGSGTPLHKRVNRDVKSAPAPHSNLSYKRPPSDTSSQSSVRSNSYGASSFPNKNKNTSPVKSSPLASSPPTNASDLDQHTTTDDSRHDHRRNRSRDRSVTVANGTINVKKRKADTDRDAIDVAVAEKKRQRLSTELLDKARKFKSWYSVYQGLHHELSASSNFDEEKYSKLLDMHHRLEKLKGSIYSQIPEGL